MRIVPRTSGLLLSVLAALIAQPASATRYVLDASSTVTPSGESSQTLTGTFALTFEGLCFAPIDPATCARLDYDFTELDLAWAGGNVTLGGIVPIPGFDFPSLAGDVLVDLPGPAQVDSFVFERDTIPPRFAMEQRFLERSIRSATPNTAATPVFAPGEVLPHEIFLALEVVERERLVVFPSGSVSTVSSDVVATLDVRARLPEPGAAALWASGALAFAVRRFAVRRFAVRSRPTCGAPTGPTPAA